MRRSTDTVHTGLHCGRRPLSSTVIWDYGARKGWRASIIPARRDRRYNSNSQTSCALIVNEKYCRYRFYLYLTNNTVTSSHVECTTKPLIYTWRRKSGTWQTRERCLFKRDDSRIAVKDIRRDLDKCDTHLSTCCFHMYAIWQQGPDSSSQGLTPIVSFVSFPYKALSPWSSSKEVKSIACFVAAVPLRVSVLQHDDQRDVHCGTHSSRSSRQSHLLHIQKWQISPNESTGCLSSKHSHAIKNKKESIAFHLLLRQNKVLQLREP